MPEGWSTHNKTCVPVYAWESGTHSSPCPTGSTSPMPGTADGPVPQPALALHDVPAQIPPGCMCAPCMPVSMHAQFSLPHRIHKPHAWNGRWPSPPAGPCTASWAGTNSSRLHLCPVFACECVRTYTPTPQDSPAPCLERPLVQSPSRPVHCMLCLHRFCQAACVPCACL